MSDLQCAARLLIARHGETERETEHPDDAGSLSVVGMKQAREMAAALEDGGVSLIYCGATAPAVQTAEIVAEGLGVRVRDLFQERDVGDDTPSWIAEELQAVVDLHRGETVLVVCDGGAIRSTVPRLSTNLPDSFGTSHEVAHGAFIGVAADADGFVVRSWAGEAL